MSVHEVNLSKIETHGSLAVPDLVNRRGVKTRFRFALSLCAFHFALFTLRFFSSFLSLSVNISKTVADTAKVTIND